MKKYLTLLAALVLAVVTIAPVNAAWNIRQKGSGAAVWTDGTVEVPTGNAGMVLHITEVGTESTWFVVSHKKGTFRTLYAVPQTSITAGGTLSVLDVSIATGTTPNQFVPVSAFTLSVSDTAGVATSGSPTLTGIGLQSVTVNQGDVIAVHTDGGGGSQDAIAIIVVE